MSVENDAPASPDVEPADVVDDVTAASDEGQHTETETAEKAEKSKAAAAEKKAVEPAAGDTPAA